MRVLDFFPHPASLIFFIFQLKTTNAEKFLLEITIKKINENEARELYDDLIKGDIAALTKAKSRGKDKRENISRVLRNLESVFTGVYLHYDNASKSESE